MPFLILYSNCPDSTMSSQHIFCLSCSFLLVVSWWLFYSYIYFSSRGEQENFHTHCHKPISMTWKTPGSFRPQNRILRDTGTKLYKATETGTFPGKVGWIGSLTMKASNRIAHKALFQRILYTTAWFRKAGFWMTGFHTFGQKIQCCVLARLFALSWFL